MLAAFAANTQEPMLQPTACEEIFELPLDIARQGLSLCFELGPLPAFLKPKTAPCELYRIAAQTLFHGECQTRPLFDARSAQVACWVSYTFGFG